MNFAFYLRRFVKEVNREGLRSAIGKTVRFLRVGREPESIFGHLRHDPLITVIIVSYNSSKDLPACLRSLSQQSYSRKEIIVVENGSEDTKDLVLQHCPTALWFSSPHNLGFAAANNDAYKFAKGEFVALVNPDARLDADCLAELISAFRCDGQLAVATPKLRFWERFVDIRLQSTDAFSVSLEELDAQLFYKKHFIRAGLVHAGRVCSVKSSGEAQEILLRLPVDGSVLQLSTYATVPVKLVLPNGREDILDPVGGVAQLSLELSVDIFPSAFWVINNAGSGLRDGNPYDIGFGERDEHHFDGGQLVPAFCGCVALIRRAALLGRPIFRPEYFAYFEDSELSFHIQQAGWGIRYVPRALAYHRHSESSSEGSVLWRVLVGRSRLIYNLCCKKPQAQQEIARFLADAARYQAVAPSLGETLHRLDKSIGHQERRKTLGVYNSFWNTFGGGEAHALGVALRMADKFDEIYLISESDFDIASLEDRFHLDLRRFKKLVISHVSGAFTGLFDVFINSTFHSNLISEAKKSYYIVSFPHKNPADGVIGSYFFLYNSKYTMGWASSYWAGAAGSVLYPTFSLPPAPAEVGAKSQVAVSVGRITRNGHAKNQDAIIRAFMATCEWPEAGMWRLYVMGSCDLSNVDDRAYLATLNAMSAKDSRIRIIPNCPREDLMKVLAEASIYVHATGLGVDQQMPEKQEHFGIAVLEAALFGALPIVYDDAGPAELVDALGFGSTYRTEADLTDRIGAVIKGDFEIDARGIIQAAQKFCVQNEAHLTNLT